MCHVKCYTNSFSKNLPILTSLQLQGFKIIIKHTSLCNTDGKPNINVNVSGQRVHQHRALPDSGSLGWSYIGRPYLSITLASMMLQYTDPEVYGQNNMEASVCEVYTVQRNTEHGTEPADVPVHTISVLLMVKQSKSQVYTV